VKPNNRENLPVLITGAGGFIGSHLAEYLVDAGYKVRAMVRYNSRGCRGWLDQCPSIGKMEVRAGDIRDADFVNESVRGTKCVFHLAALIGIPYSYIAPESYVQTNITGTLNVLQAARKNGSIRVIHTSTSECYGTACAVPIGEGHPLQGQSPYAATKIGADKLVESFYLSFGLPTVTVRPFNTFGPRQSARAIIPSVITQLLSEDGIVRVGNISPSRDLNYVSNTVEGFALAAGSDNAVGKTINLGSGREITIGALIELIAAILGKPFTIETESQRVRPQGSEVERLLADHGLATNLLGWRPRVSLEEGLVKTVKWMANNGGQYRADEYAV
jgi:NAD dependent epimerase/dehydratase